MVSKKLRGGSRADSLTGIEYIVSLPSFVPAESHFGYLEGILGAQEERLRWTLAPRSLVVAQMPSDFVVVRFNSETEADLLSLLHNSDKIKHVHPQKRYSRSPLQLRGNKIERHV